MQAKGCFGPSLVLTFGEQIFWFNGLRLKTCALLDYMGSFIRGNFLVCIGPGEFEARGYFSQQKACYCGFWMESDN